MYNGIHASSACRHCNQILVRAQPDQMWPVGLWLDLYVMEQCLLCLLYSAFWWTQLLVVCVTLEQIGVWCTAYVLWVQFPRVCSNVMLHSWIHNFSIVCVLPLLLQQGQSGSFLQPAVCSLLSVEECGTQPIGPLLYGGLIPSFTCVFVCMCLRLECRTLLCIVSLVAVALERSMVAVKLTLEWCEFLSVSASPVVASSWCVCVGMQWNAWIRSGWSSRKESLDQ